MRLQTAVIATSLLTFILSGCSDYDKIQEGVIENNQRVSLVLESNENVHSYSIPIEDKVISIFSGSPSDILSNVTQLSSDEELKVRVCKYTEAIADYVESYISIYNHSAEDIIRGRNFTKIENANEFVESVTETHYFIDDSNGTVEQMFIIQLPDGFVGTISLYWLGGTIIDAKTTRSN